MSWNLSLHSHLHPWTDDIDHTVVDSYRFIGKQVIVWDGKFGMQGRLVGMDSDRIVTLIPGDGDPCEIRASRIEAVGDAP